MQVVSLFGPYIFVVMHIQSPLTLRSKTFVSSHIYLFKFDNYYKRIQI